MPVSTAQYEHGLPERIDDGRMPVTVNKLHEQFGAEIQGVDITSPIDGETAEALRDAFSQYSVLVFHDQEITDEQHVAFSEHFGRLQMTIKSDPYGGGGPINRLSNVDENGEIIPPEDARMKYYFGNELWHSDGAFTRVPFRGSLLSAKVVPPEQGETEYACVHAAYAALPEEKKDSLEGLIVEHSMAHSRAQVAPDLVAEAFQKDAPPVQHALVRTIPETGEKTLLVGSYASHVVGWPIEEGRTLLKELLEWSTQRQFVYSHTWRANDLVMWDNRHCLHRARSFDSARYKRIMHRTALAGDGPTVERN